MADKSADFAADFAKSADFIVAGNRAVSDLLLALEQTPERQDEEVRRRAQQARHVLQTMENDWTKLAERVKALGAELGGTNGGKDVHVHVHLHLNSGDGSVTLRPEK